MRTILREGEESVFSVQRHWIVLLEPIAVMAFAVFIFHQALVNEVKLLKEVAVYILAAAALYAAYRAWFWTTDVWIITNQRVIDETGVITLNTRQLPLDKINNVDYTQTLLGRILGYGDVEIYTAASDAGQASMKNTFISRPLEFQNEIVRAQEEYRKTLKETSSSACDLKEPMKKCPYCAEYVKADAIVCKHCQHDLKEPEISASSDSSERHFQKAKPWSRYREG